MLLFKMTVHVFVLFLIMAMRISVACRLPSSYRGSREMEYVCWNVRWWWSGSCKPSCEDGHYLSIHGAIYLQYKQWWTCSGRYRIEDVTQNIYNCISHDRDYCNSWSTISSIKNPKPYKGHKTLFINYTCSENSEEYSAETGDFVIDSGSGMDNMTDYDSMLEMDRFTNLTIFNSTYEWMELITEPPKQSAFTKPTVEVTSPKLPPDVNSNSNRDEQHGDKDEPKEVGQAKSVFSTGPIAGLVIGVLVVIAGLSVLVVFVILRQRRLSKRLNEIETPVYKDPAFTPNPQVVGSYDNEVYGQVTESDIELNGKGPAKTAYDDHAANKPEETIYDNNVHNKQQKTPYIAIVPYSNTYDEVIINPGGQVYSVLNKDNVISNAPPEDEAPDVPADYELTQSPVPFKNFTNGDSHVSDNELLDNDAYIAFDDGDS